MEQSANARFERHKKRLALLVCGVVVLCDQLTKWLAVAFLTDVPPYRAFEVVPGKVMLHLSYNEAGMLGLLSALPDAVKPALFLAFTVGFVAYLVWLLRRATPAQAHEIPPVALLLAGFLGNGVDRLFHGAVVDFVVIHLQSGAVAANVADVAIFAGLGWLILGRLRDLLLSRGRTSPADAESR